MSALLELILLLTLSSIVLAKVFLNVSYSRKYINGQINVSVPDFVTICLLGHLQNLDLTTKLPCKHLVLVC